MNYDAATAQMLCPSCGDTRDLPKDNDLIVENSFSDGLAVEGPTGLTGFGVETHEYTCKNCGAITSTSASEPVLVCGFCSSEALNEAAFETRVIQPAGVMPFAVENRQALQTYKDWLGKGWFHPSNLATLARLDRIHGIYIPFWTYDASTDSQWTAEAGYFYYETVTRTDSEGNTVTEQVQRIRWVPVSGFFQHAFDDVLVIGSKGIQQHMVERVYPFPLEKTVNYNSQFMAGWKAEVYGLDVQKGFDIADGIMDSQLHSLISGIVPGDTQRFLSVNTHKYDLTFKHLLLPVWVAAYVYNGKTYQVLVNGSTGKIAGDKPYSTIKIVFAVLIGIIIAVILYLLFSK